MKVGGNQNDAAQGELMKTMRSVMNPMQQRNDSVMNPMMSEFDLDFKVDLQ